MKQHNCEFEALGTESHSKLGFSRTRLHLYIDPIPHSCSVHPESWNYCSTRIPRCYTRASPAIFLVPDFRKYNLKCPGALCANRTDSLLRNSSRAGRTHFRIIYGVVLKNSFCFRSFRKHLVKWFASSPTEKSSARFDRQTLHEAPLYFPVIY